MTEQAAASSCFQGFATEVTNLLLKSQSSLANAESLANALVFTSVQSR